MPSRRMSVARTQRDSVRETASITRVLQLLDRPDLDHGDARRWEPRGDRAGLVHVLGLDDEESTQLLLCLDKGADGRGGFTGAGADGPGRLGPLESVRGDVVAAPSNLLRVLDRGVDKRLHLLLGHRVQHVLVVVDHEHELHRNLLTGDVLDRIYQADNLYTPFAGANGCGHQLVAPRSRNRLDSRSSTELWCEACALARSDAPIRIRA